MNAFINYRIKMPKEVWNSIIRHIHSDFQKKKDDSFCDAFLKKSPLMGITDMLSI